MSGSKEIILREATPLDAEPLNDFFSQIPIEGKVKIKIRRQVDFFSFYKRLGFNFKSFIFENSKALQQKKPQILGTASFLFQDRLLNHQVKKIALACDLRISSNRKAILNWSKYFLPKIAQLQNEEKIDHFITSINLTEAKAINAFLRPRSQLNSLPIYEFIQKFNVVSVHGFIPAIFSLQKNIIVRHATESDKETLEKYVLNKLNDYELTPVALTNEFQKYISDSILYSFTQFLIAKDVHGTIVGCTHPISSGLLQDYFPQAYDGQANNFRQFLKFASFFRFARKLTRPFSSTSKEETLNFKILHFLFFDHPEVFKSLLHYAFKTSAYEEFLMYAYQTNQYAYRPPRGALSARIPHALYEIKKPDSPAYQTKIKTLKLLFLDHFWF